MPGSLLVAALFLPLAVGDLSARFVSGPEADTNARREVMGEAPRPDILWRNQLFLTAAPRFLAHRVLLDGQVGHKGFFREKTEDLFVAELRVRHDTRWLQWLATFFEASGRDRRQRSFARTYTTASADAGAMLGPFGPVTILLGAGPRTFFFWPDLRFANAGAGVFSAVIFKAWSMETLTLSSGVETRMFAGPRASLVHEDGTRQFDETWRRLDATPYVDLSVESVRALYLRASARATHNESNSIGEQYTRLRLALTVGAVFPGGVRLLLDAQVQATRWPLGLGLGERLALQEGDENQTSAGVQLSVPLVAGVWMEGRTYAYTAEFSSARVPFLRVTAFVGLGYRL